MNKQSGSQLNPQFNILNATFIIAGLSFFALIGFLVTNPKDQLVETRNAQRRTDVQSIRNLVTRYISQTHQIPKSIPASETCGNNPSDEICRFGNLDCKGFVDLSSVIKTMDHPVGLPVDPKAKAGSGTGYHIIKRENNGLIVCAPLAENHRSIFSKQP